MILLRHSSDGSLANPLLLRGGAKLALMTQIDKTQPKGEKHSKKKNQKEEKRTGIPPEQREDILKQLRKGETL